MAIQRQRTYTDVEVNQIIRASERRPSYGRGERPGHTGVKHVLITNVDMADRADDEAGKPRRRNEHGPRMTIICAFAGTPEAVRAVTEAFNSAKGQEVLKFLDEYPQTRLRVVLEAEVPTPFVVRYTGGMQIVRTAPATRVRVVMERIEEAAYHGLHIQTAFPVMWLDHGQPAWRVDGGPWR